MYSLAENIERYKMTIKSFYLFHVIKRHAFWLIMLIGAILLFNPQIEEFTTIMFIITVELIAIALSGVATYVYTRIDFPSHSPIVLGFIFLGVHICAGLTILGVYLVQFG
ncbi:MAG: hypothetical protein CVV22_10295 [Ignavibacteriae bacterium HGW-Ignavibacteriae-1]|jgi:hypothetical protein|nr:MAG: hypothetical protein CVV22_10295 [Ignavibacteriae bacterium HGW-Ignavibacteriae-1]